MGYWLLENPVKYKPKWYDSRRGELRVIVLHITAGLEGRPSSADNSAEATAQYCANTDRKVSWHSGSDTDTAFALLPPSYTAFHCAGYNSIAYGHEISKRTTDWKNADPEWVARTLTLAALFLGPIARQHNIPFIRQSREAVDRGARGFAYHADLDPGRRSDPGMVKGVDTFPMGRFLDLMKGVQPPKPKVGKPVFLYEVQNGDDKGKTFIGDGIETRYVDDTAELGWLETARDENGQLLYGKARKDVPTQLHTSMKLVKAD